MVCLEFRNIHELMKFIEKATGSDANKNKIYQAMKRGKTYKGFNISFEEPKEDLIKFNHVETE